MEIEPLERRRLLAGVVYVVEEDAGTQGLSGAEGPVDVTIGYAADKRRNYVLADHLIVDDQPFTDGRYFIRKPNLHVTLSPFDDTLRFTGGDFDDMNIRMGGGNDRVEWNGRPAGGGPSSATSVDLQLDEGDDRLVANDMELVGHLFVTGGSGRDRFDFSGRTNMRTLIVGDSSGPSSVNIAGAAIDLLGIRTGNSIDRVAISGGYIHDSLKLETRGGNDVVSLTNYERPSEDTFVVKAGTGDNQVTDTPLTGTPTIGRLDAVFRKNELDLVGRGPLQLDFVPSYGSMEEDAGTYVNTDVPIYVNGERQASLLLDRVPTFSLIQVRLDNAAQRVSVDYDGFLFSPPSLDLATGGGNDTVNLSNGPSNTGIDVGGGDDRVTLATPSISTVRLGLGRDRVTILGGQQVNIYDNGGSATIVAQDATITGGLYIETSEAIDHVTLSNMVATRLGLRLGGGADVLSETNVQVTKRDVDLGPQ